ncbi:cilia- and flagella-associated protein 69 [Andrena cerasifolii]|uniref:cilia- and flagella-associated protein 69 n=1 Tax=Andrena cerasifolii TaxID=2819439 RepID=UPI004037BD51
MSAGQKELDSGDIWKDFHCPKYVTPVCPETDKIPKDIFESGEQSTVVANYALRKLCELISDPVTSNSAPRICRLLHEYLHATGDNGYKLKDLPMIMKVLEFLAQNVQAYKEYEPHLEQMLDLCNLPPLLEKSSEGAINFDIMEQYFTLLGHLLLILPTEARVLKIHKALYSLLLGTKFIDVTAVKREYCCRAMEKSNLPITLTELLCASRLDMYGKVLELVLLLSSVSHTCSHRMMQAGALNTIFTRMDLPFATQLRCTRPPDSLLPGNEYSRDMTFLIMTTVWSLLKSVLPPNVMPVSLKETVTSIECGLWGLAYAFERQVHRGQYRSNCLKIRNEMAVVILVVIILFPSWNFVSSGIADEAIRFLVGVEAGSVRVFSERVNFGRSNADLYFQKTLLVITMHLVEIDACIYVII